MKFDDTFTISVTVVFLIICTYNANSQNNEDDFNYARELSRPGEFNERCRSVRDCRKFGYVCRDNRTCQCDNMYAPNFQRTSCVGGVNQRCVYDEHCIEGAYCMNQAFCKCKDTTPVILEYGLVCSKATKSSNFLFKTMYVLFALFFLW